MGFRVRHSRYFNSLGFLGWWVNARVLRRQRQSESQIELFDRVFVPALSRLERIIEPPFGQSIFSVLEAEAHSECVVRVKQSAQRMRCAR